MNSQNKKYKIALVGYRLGIGGAEKVMANLSVFFDKKGIEVHNIIILDVVSYLYAGKLLNLGKLKSGSNSVFNKFNRLQVLRNYLKENQFDYIIDFRFRNKPLQEYIIAKWIYNAPTIFSVRSYLIDHYMSNWTWLTQKTYGNCYKIVSVSKKTQELIETKHQLKNVTTIYNPLLVESILELSKEEINFDYQYIMGIGQMETNIKQFDKLITAYANSVLPQKGIHLVIVGDGVGKITLQQQINNLNLTEKVHFVGYQKNPFKYLKRAKFFVLSSKNEGMPNVILESLACGTPVLAFDCLSGPSEMIIDKENGLLVENQNVTKLTEAMNLFEENEGLYNYCKENSFSSIALFSVENIGKQWLNLMNINVKNG